MEKIKKHNVSFFYLNIMIYILILLPKSTFPILDKIPLRLGLLTIYIILFFIDYKKNKIILNKKDFKILEILFLIFLIFTIPSILISKSLIVSFYTIIKYLISFIVFILILRMEITTEELKILFKNIIFASCLTIVYGIICYVFDINLLKVSNYLYPGSNGRVESTFFNSIYFGVFLNIIFPLLFYKMTKSDGKKENLYTIVLLLLFIALIFTYTRSALLIFLGLLLMTIILFRKNIFKKNTVILILCFALSILVIPGAQKLMNNSLRDGYKTISNIASFLPKITAGDNDENNEYVDYNNNSEFIDYSLQHRESFARIAKQIGRDNLYTGVGFGTYMNYMESTDFDIKYPEYNLSKTHPHSTFILLFAETGIFSTFLMFAIFGILFVDFILGIIKNFKEKNEIYYISSIGFCIVTGFFGVNLIAENAIYDTQIFPIFLIIIALLFNMMHTEKNKYL